MAYEAYGQINGVIREIEEENLAAVSLSGWIQKMERYSSLFQQIRWS